MLAAIVFDFDGIIVDSEPLHHQAFVKALEPEGLSFTWEAYLAEYVGYDDRDAFRAAFAKTEREVNEEALRALIASKAQAFYEMATAQAVPAYPGVCPLVQEASAEMPLALCSGALRQDIEPILERLALTDSFSVIVAADDVARSKPDPESYALAVTRLIAGRSDRGIRPDTCLAVEDTPTGIESARRAGLPVLAVTNNHPESELCGAQWVVGSLDDVTLDRLRDWMS